jgi:hypothetical protein
MIPKIFQLKFQRVLPVDFIQRRYVHTDTKLQYFTSAMDNFV